MECSPPLHAWDFTGAELVDCTLTDGTPVVNKTGADTIGDVAVSAVVRDRCDSTSPATGVGCVLIAGHEVRHCGPRPEDSRYRERWAVTPSD